jgi:ATP-dependent protease ClpP protease subunit
MKQAKSWAKWEGRTEKTMRELYVEACMRGSKFEGRTRSQVRARIKTKLDSDEDWYLSPREAVEYGFADAVLGDEGFESIEYIKKHWE